MPPSRKRELDEDDVNSVSSEEQVVPLKKSKVETASGKTKAKAKKLGGKEGKKAKAAEKILKAKAAGPPVTESSLLAGTVPFKRLHSDEDFCAKSMLKFVTWNVAGLRAQGRADELLKFVTEEKPDVLCLQETKLSDLADAAKIVKLEGYSFTDNISTGKKGYSGTRTYIRDDVKVDTTTTGFGDGADEEGRILTSTIGGMHIVNSYVPNSGMKLDRLEYRVEDFDAKMRAYIAKLQTTGPVVWTGDLNVAERDYDRFFTGTFKQMEKTCGFTPQERASFRTTVADCDLVDAFRAKYPKAQKAYSFWSMRFGQRAKNNGWRLDYFVVSAALTSRIVECFTASEYAVSDHSPVVMWLNRE